MIDPIELNDKTFTKDVLDKTTFFQIAEAGAMGEGGGIVFVTEDGTVYHANYCYGDLKWETLQRAFPVIDQCQFGITHSEVPEGWVYENLGMGNHLIVRRDRYDGFARLASKCKSMGELYQKWLEFATEQAPASEAEIRLVKGDITKITDVEAIVNAANRSLLGGGGVDGAIHRAAGPKLLEECRGLHGCETGEAKITGAYNLPCKYVIHTVGPIWGGGNRSEEKLLANCYRNSLQTAVDNKIRTIAFPSISTGVYSYPLEEAAAVAVRTVDKFIKDHPGELDLVEWVLFDYRTYDAYDRALDQLRAKKS